MDTINILILSDVKSIDFITKYMVMCWRMLFGAWFAVKGKIFASGFTIIPQDHITKMHATMEV